MPQTLNYCIRQALENFSIKLWCEELNSFNLVVLCIFERLCYCITQFSILFSKIQTLITDLLELKWWVVTFDCKIKFDWTNENQPYFFILNKGMIFFVDDLITSVFIRPFDDKEILLCFFLYFFPLLLFCFSALRCEKLFGLFFNCENWTVFCV